MPSGIKTPLKEQLTVVWLSGSWSIGREIWIITMIVGQEKTNIYNIMMIRCQDDWYFRLCWFYESPCLAGRLVKSSIDVDHSFMSILVYLHGAVGGCCLFELVIGWEAGYSLDWLPVHHRTDNHAWTLITKDSRATRLPSLEKTHASGVPANSMQKDSTLGFEPRTFCWKSCANCVTVQLYIWMCCDMWLQAVRRRSFESWSCGSWTSLIFRLSTGWRSEELGGNGTM